MLLIEVLCILKGVQHSQQRQKAFVNYKDYIGRDITSLVTLPVWIMEPYTMLQKVAEIMEYTELLDRAAVTEDPYERCAHLLLSPFQHGFMEELHSQRYTDSISTVSNATHWPTWSPQLPIPEAKLLIHSCHPEVLFRLPCLAYV